MDRESAARQIAQAAKRLRTPNPRWLWISALVVSAVCLGSLAIGLLTH
jgi:hypothetical protein